MQLEPRQQRGAGEHATSSVLAPIRPVADADFIYSSKCRVTLGLDDVDLGDASFELELRVEATDDPLGLAGWRIAASGKWRGGKSGRNSTWRIPRLSVACAWFSSARRFRISWSQSRAAPISVDVEISTVDFNARSHQSVGIDSGSAGQGEVVGDSLTISIVTSAGTNLLIAGLNNFTNIGSVSFLSATHNGASFVSVNTATYGGSTDLRGTMLRKTGVSIGTFDVIITPDTPANNLEIEAVVLGFTGVDQTTPLGTSQKDVTLNVTSSTINVSRGADDMVVSICTWFEQAVTVGGDLTQRVYNDNLGQNIESVILSTSTVDSSIDSTYSWASAEGPCHIAVNILAAPLAAAGLRAVVSYHAA